MANGAIASVAAANPAAADANLSPLIQRRTGAHWVPPAVFLLAAAFSAGLLLWAVGDRVFALVFLAGLIAAAGILFLLLRPRDTAAMAVELRHAPDIGLARLVLDAAGKDFGFALTDFDGELVSANSRWESWFGTASPLQFGPAALAMVTAARRDGQSPKGRLETGGETFSAEVLAQGEHLLWRVARSDGPDLADEAARLLPGEIGNRAGDAGLMLVLADADGKIRSANSAFVQRALGEGSGRVSESLLVDHLATSSGGRLHFASEGDSGPPLRILELPVGTRGDGQALFLLLDDLSGPRIGEDGNEHIHALLDSLPLGLALADTDGRFSFLNKAFRKVAGLPANEHPAWPGDLVVDEDKAAVSDAVRRFGRTRSLSGDLAVRMRCAPDEPVAMTVSGARGLGNAAVLLSLKDNSEEARLKREVAQATKMQAVGQLAGGIAHDFNNLLTAILGTCDLMLMRHTPGDSDYDDIQQVRSNTNRAASLTRQLLAFSRQQTLRPQVLQLPDVVAEVSHLLTRLLGERIKLKVKHGRGLGPVRADPVQLEHVIINLAVNARDAMHTASLEGGGTLTMQTFAVSADDVRRMGTDILPVADYTALKVSDTGTGIPPHIIGKVFEPFFTTKEVGKGTGLGLSTVYGIVKQSGGFIFAESQPGKGAAFSLYFPVHRAQPGDKPARTPTRTKPGELWGSGTILLVEDEAMVRTVAERALTRHGYSVLIAENGEAAIEILTREKRVDLMVSDVMMPTMDGPTTAREARKLQPDLPILFISGYAQEQLRKSIDLPNVSFLAKPFSVPELAETVRGVLAGK